MNPITHSHWHATDDEEVEIPIRDTSRKPKANERIAIPSARRTPAAIIGILIFAALGISAVQGWSDLLGQSVTPLPDILISDLSLTPAVLTVAPGQLLLIRNEATIPQILRFNDLIDSQGKPLESSAIFPQSETRVTVPITAAQGRYEYYSTTSVHISGSLIVSLSAIVQSTAVTASSPASTFVKQPVESSAAFASSLAPVNIPTIAGITTPDSTILAAVLPVNPYAVGTETIQPSNNLPDDISYPDITEHMPQTTTESGSAAWATIIVFAISFLFVLRKAEA